jgi:hypothetical protein
MKSLDKKNSPVSGVGNQQMLEDKIESRVENFIANFNKRAKDESRSQKFQPDLLKQLLKELTENVAMDLGTYSKEDYLTKLKEEYTVGDGSMGRKTSAFDEIQKKLLIDLNENPKLSLKAKLYNAVSDIAHKVGLREIAVKYEEKAKDAQQYSSMKTLSSKQKKVVQDIKKYVEDHRKTSDNQKILHSPSIPRNLDKTKNPGERGRG